MGTSNWQNISYNIELIRKLNPMSILDIGVGFGRWGILFRELLEIWENSRYDGKWERVLDGVEIFPGYIKDYHKYFYDNIYIENAGDFLEKTDKRYDLINMGDVIEHFDKKEGQQLINTALEKGRHVLINVPIGSSWEQEGTISNPYEEHKSVWRISDFTKFRYCKIKRFSDLELREYSVVLLSAKKIKYDKKYGKYFGIKNVLKHKFGMKKAIEKYEKRKR